MKLLLPALASLTLTFGAAAQTHFGAMPGERSSTMLAAFDMKAFTSPGWLVVNYGQPTWKAEYDAMADALKGKTARLGKDFWTTLEASCDLTLGTTKVPAGYYYLAIKCSTKGDWSLLLLDSAEARKQKLLPSMTEKIVSDGLVKSILEVPMTHAKPAQSADKMMMTLTADDSKLGHGNFSITWGTHQVSAPVACDIPADTKKDHPKDAPGAKKEAAPAKK